jgi:hypothetical protein
VVCIGVEVGALMPDTRLTVTLPPDLLRRFRVACLGMKLTDDKGVELALTQWLDVLEKARLIRPVGE